MFMVTIWTPDLLKQLLLLLLLLLLLFLLFFLRRSESFIITGTEGICSATSGGNSSVFAIVLAAVFHQSCAIATRTGSAGSAGSTGST